MKPKRSETEKQTYWLRIIGVVAIINLVIAVTIIPFMALLGAIIKH